MSDKSTNRDCRYAWPGMVVVPVRITFGASTAITNWRALDVTTVVKTNTGLVTVTLAHGFAGGCLGIFGYSREGAAGTAHLFPIVTTDNTDSTSSSPTLAITLTSEAGTATDPTSGDVYTFFLAFDELNMVQTVTP